MDIRGREQTEYIMNVGGNYAALILIVGIGLYFFVRWKGYKPNFILFLVIYLFPTSVLFIDIGFHLYYHRILLILYLAWFVFTKIFKSRDLRKLINGTTICAFYFLIMCLPGLLVAYDFGAFFRWWLSIFMGILFYLIILDKIKDKEMLRDILFSCIVSGVAWSVTGLVLFAFGNPTLEVDDIKQLYRVSALSRDANFFASILIPWIQIAFFWFIQKDAKNRLFVFLSMMTMLGAFILTYSRGGFLALTFISILNLAYLTLFKGRFNSRVNFKGVKITVIVTVICAITAVVAMESLRDRILSIGDDSTLGAGRGYIWFDALNVIKRNPLGVGLNNYQAYTIKNRTKYKTAGASVHNVFLHLTAETGIQGIITYLIFLSTVLFKIRHLPKIRDGDISHWFVGGFIAFISIQICSFFISNVYRENIFLAIAIFLAIFKLHKNEDRHFSPKRGVAVPKWQIPNNHFQGK